MSPLPPPGKKSQLRLSPATSPTTTNPPAMRPSLRPSILLAPIRCSCHLTCPRPRPSRAYAAAPKPPPPVARLLTAAHKVLAAAQAANEDGSGSIEAAKKWRELEPLRRALEDVGEGEEVSAVERVELGRRLRGKQGLVRNRGWWRAERIPEVYAW